MVYLVRNVETTQCRLFTTLRLDKRHCLLLVQL